jgi:hypothetical protein
MGEQPKTLAPYRLNETCESVLATSVPPAFIFLHGPRSPKSSTGQYLFLFLSRLRA